MSEIFNVDDSNAVYVGADTDNQKRITNISNTTLYYDNASTVSSGSNDGSLTQGQSVEITQGNYIIGSALTQVMVEELAGENKVDAINLRAGTTSASGITFGTDTNLYRSAADTLKTDDSVVVAGAAGVTVSGNGGKTTVAISNTGSNIGITLGGDTNLYRSGANALKTDDALTAGAGLTVTGAATVSTTLGVTGVTTTTGGVAGGSSHRPTLEGAITLTTGTDTACDNGTRFYGEVFVPANATLTGIEYLIGSVGGTDSVVVYLWDAAGTVVANSALAGATVGTAATYQQVAFTAPYAAVGPAVYFVGVQFNGATAKFRTIPTGTRRPAASNAGTFGTAAVITPPTTFTADKAPVAWTY